MNEEEYEFLGIQNNWTVNFDGNCQEDMTNFEIDMNLAIAIGHAYFSSIWSDEMLKSTRGIVYEISEQDLFVVGRWPKSEPGMEIMVGGDVNIAISKKNGAILAIFYGE